MVRYALSQAKKKARLLVPMAMKAAKAGFLARLSNSDESLPLLPYIEMFPENFDSSVEIGQRFSADRDGALIVSFAGEDIAVVAYREDGSAHVRLPFLSGPRKDLFLRISARLVEFKRTFFDEITYEEFDGVIDFAAAFLAGIRDFDYRFEVHAADKPFLRGAFDRPDMNLEVLDPMTYFRLLLYGAKGAEAMKLKITSPLQILSIIESFKDALKLVAETYEYYKLRVCLTAGGKCVASLGDGVKSNLGQGFGPTAVHLESLFSFIAMGV